MIHYSRDDLDNLKQLPILELADKLGISVQKSGGAYQAQCVHKGDNTPSLTFYPGTNTFHCFGCGCTGDNINLVSFVSDLPFPLAVQKIADLYKVNLTGTAISGHSQEVNRLLIKARKYWRNLNASEEAKLYLANRGMIDNDIEVWRLGLSAETDKYCPNRITFPIMNEYSEIVGFAYRTLKNETPKYINSAESDLFKKGQLLYGLNYAKQGIREQNIAVLVEGYFDVIQMQKVGVPAVGQMGSALTKLQVELLKRYTNNVILFMDNDLAGQKAVERNYVLLKENGFTVKIFFATGDPDEYATEHQEEAWQNILNDAKDYVAYKLNQSMFSYQVKRDDISLQLLAEVAPMLTSLTTATELSYYVGQLAATLHMDRLMVYDYLTKGGHYGQN